jgi:hypothetical protein
MKLKKFNCCICGKEEDPNEWVKDCSEKLVKYHMCHTCNFWREQHELDHTVRGEHNYAIVNGTHYVLAPHTDGYFKGFGGRKFTFEFNDGTVKECDNVWCQGDITEEHPHWRELMPDNAVIRQ